MDLGLYGRTAVVTGGARGIGAAISQSLAEEGVRVLVADIDGSIARDTAATIQEKGGVAIGCECDVTNSVSVGLLRDRAAAEFGGIDILINNAGFTRDMRIGKMSEGDWDSVVDVILKGAFLCTKAFLPTMIERRFGRVINISSRAHLGNSGQANYSAAKAGLLGFTRAMALEAGRSLITVNAVAPGVVETEAVRALPHFAAIREGVEKSVAIPRMGLVSDVADAVLFLASARAGYISGEVLHVTGGRY